MKYASQRLALGLVFGLVGLLVLLAATPERPAPTVGRYQIHSGRVLLNGITSEGPTSVETPAIIRIDTTTGESHLLQRLNIKGKPYEYWRPIDSTAPKIEF